MNLKDYKSLLKESDGCPVVYQDFFVHAWRVYDIYSKAKCIFRKEKNLETIVKCSWAIILNNTPILETFGDNRVVVLSDYRTEKLGGYWRHSEVGKDVRMSKLWGEYNPKKKDIGYKGGRGEKPEDFNDLIIGIGKDYCKKYFSFYEFEGYEADDLGGYVYRNCGEQRDRLKLFHTIDRDWMQLVDEDRGFYWTTSRIPRQVEKFQNQIADNAEVLTFSEDRHKLTIKTPKEFILSKIITGDSGDNLPPQCPPEYMDLTLPHPIYNIDTIAYNSGIVEDSYNLLPNTNIDHYNESNDILKRMNVSFNF